MTSPAASPVASLDSTVFDTGGTLVVGAGLAGLFLALKLAPVPCTVLSPEPVGEGASSSWAQGGIAAAVASGDSAAAHAADTIAAGAGTVDPRVARSVTAEGAARIDDLLAIGTPFDRDEDGNLVASREAAHSASRVVRVSGDGAGRAIMAAIIARALATPSIRVIEGVVADDIALESGRVTGVFARRTADPYGQPLFFRARATVLATGGIGGLFAVSTNPGRVRGQGLGMAARAGALIADAEFVQFHPTGIAVDRDPCPLATEALRGEGAVIIDETGERFMTAVHPDAELAPRDIVARAIHAKIAAGGRAFLDTRAALGEKILHEFPTVAGYCRDAGIDPVTQPIPIQPAQHFHMGGIATDDGGRSSLPGLWVCGESSSTGLHGANRLASNSLLEAVVFGARIATDIAGLEPLTPSPPLPAFPDVPPGDLSQGLAPPEAAVKALRRLMTAHVGVERNAEGLRLALAEIAELERTHAPGSRAFLNMTTAATLIAAAALKRRESRGGHYRSDYPAADPEAARRSMITLAEALEIRAAT